MVADMEVTNRLSIKDLEEILHDWDSAAVNGFIGRPQTGMDAVRQLLDTMRENERYRQILDEIKSEVFVHAEPMWEDFMTSALIRIKEILEDNPNKESIPSVCVACGTYMKNDSESCKCLMRTQNRVQTVRLDSGTEICFVDDHTKNPDCCSGDLFHSQDCPTNTLTSTPS
jgi:hypothetical protein